MAAGAVALAAVLLLAPPLSAIPPLVMGDVPTADVGCYELFVGTRFQKTGGIERQVPFTELVYGVSDRQEVTFEIPIISGDAGTGFGDAVVGTKYMFVKESAHRPGIACSFELKTANGDVAQGLGSGGEDFDVRLRAEKSWGWFTGLLNAGYTFIGEPAVAGVRQDRRDQRFYAFGQEWKISGKTKLLSEIYWKSNDTPGDPHRFAFDVGFKHKLRKDLAVHAAIGESLRDGEVGGPRQRIYAGVKFDF